MDGPSWFYEVLTPQQILEFLFRIEPTTIYQTTNYILKQLQFVTR